MALGRRGFLKTLATAAGLAAFDPISKLWLPQSPEILPVTLAAFETPAQVIEQQLTLNDLAMQCARRLGQRLERHPVIGLREVMFQLSGQVELPKQLDRWRLDVEDEGEKLFTPLGHRLMVTRDDLHSSISRAHGESFADDATGELAMNIGRLDVFTPMASELRPGEPFAREYVGGVWHDTLVGLATDPDTGISVRVLRWRQDHRWGAKTLTGVEVSGGTWETVRPEPRRRQKHDFNARYRRG